MQRPKQRWASAHQRFGFFFPLAAKVSTVSTYRDPPPAPDEALSQGDVFLDVPRIIPFFGAQLLWEGEQRYRAEAVAAELRSGMKIIAEIELTRALVIEQSCDAPYSGGVALAPLEPYAPDGKTEEKQWSAISREATGLANPTRFYLPDEPTIGLGRSMAELGQKFYLPALTMRGLIVRGKRIATLTKASLAYLQFRVAAMYLRYAREDDDWPSLADLQLKRAALENQIKTKDGDIKGLQTKLAEAGDQEQKDASQAKIDLAQRLVREWTEQLAECRREVAKRSPP
jgi:hypothetical protein